MPHAKWSRIKERLGVGRVSSKPARFKNSITVGILHSLSGTMAFSEMDLVDAAQLAIEEINSSGGIDGTEIKATIVDGESDPDTFAEQALDLIVKEKVASIFGCWTSNSFTESEWWRSRSMIRLRLKRKEMF